MSAPPAWHPNSPTHTIADASKKQAFVGAIIVIVLGSLLAFAVVGGGLASLPLGLLLLVVVLAGVVVAAGTYFYSWLDRWEPEPPLFLVAAFVWGAGVSILGAGIINDLSLLILGTQELVAVVIAPLSEESIKGLFLVLVMFTTSKGRAEFNSRTDAFVYAGFVGMGFTLVEDLHYLLQAQDAGLNGIAVLILRTVAGTFAHAVFTSFTAWGLWKALTSRRSPRWLPAVGGWLIAVACHAAFNYSATYLGILAVIVVNLLLTGVVVWQAIASRKEEATAVRTQLPALVAYQWISASEGGWLASRDARRQVLSNVGAHGKHARKVLKNFVQNVTELCLVRQRLDAQAPGPFSPELLANHAMLASLVALQKPEVEQLLGSGSWRPMSPGPGAGYSSELPSQQWQMPVGGSVSGPNNQGHSNNPYPHQGQYPHINPAPPHHQQPRNPSR